MPTGIDSSNASGCKNDHTFWRQLSQFAEKRGLSCTCFSSQEHRYLGSLKELPCKIHLFIMHLFLLYCLSECYNFNSIYPMKIISCDSCMLHTTFAILILVKMYGLHLMIILMFYYPLIRFYHSSTLLYPIHPPTNHVTWDCEEIV